MEKLTEFEKSLLEDMLQGKIINIQQYRKQINSIIKKLSVKDIRNSLKLVPKILLKDEQLSQIYKKFFKTKFNKTILYQALFYIFINRNSIYHENEPEMIKGRHCHKIIFKNKKFIWTNEKINTNNFFDKKGLIAIMGSMGLGKTTYILEFLDIYFKKLEQTRPLLIIELKNGLMYEYKDNFLKLLVKSCTDAIKIFDFPMKENEENIKSEIIISLYNNPIVIIDGIDEYRGDFYTLQFLLRNLRKYGTVFIFGREERIKNLIDKNLRKTYDFYDELYKLSYLNVPSDDFLEEEYVIDEIKRNQILEYMKNFAKWKRISLKNLPSIRELAHWAPAYQTHKLSYRNPLILKILLLNTSTLEYKTKITQYSILEKLAISTFEWFIHKFKSDSVLSEIDTIFIDGIEIQINSLIKSFFKIYSKLALKSRFRKWEKHNIWIPNEKIPIIDETTITNVLDKLTYNGEIRKELYIFFFFDFLTSCSGFLQFAGDSNFQIIPERMIDFFILYEIRSLADSIENPSFEHKLSKMIGSIIGNTQGSSNLVSQFIKETKNNIILDKICTKIIQSYEDLKQIRLLKELNLSWRNHSIVSTLRGKIVFINFKSIKIDKLLKLIDKFDALRRIEFPDQKLIEFPEQIKFLNSANYLNLRKNYLKEIPKWIHNFKLLEFLNLRNNYISVLPFSICYLFDLKKLLLAHNNLTKIPASIKFLSSLEHLDLSNNNLVSIPKSIGKLESLRFLYLGHNKLHFIPDSVSALHSLEILYLKGNQIKTLPDSLRVLNKLSKLNLAENKLSIFNLKNLKLLQNLDLSSNDIQSLPDYIVNLESLEILNLENNNLNSLPESIGKLKTLKHLNLVNNKLQSIPISLLNLNSLHEVIFLDNPFYDENFYESNAILKQLEEKNIVFYLHDYSKYFCPENLERYKFELNYRATNVKVLKKYDLPILLKPDDLNKFLNITFPILVKYIKGSKNLTPSDYEYRRFRIKKKSKGFREILAPKPQLKSIQYEIHERILKKITPSEYAHGFRIKYSIVSNAKVHLNAKFVYNIDIKDFFPSIKFDKVISFFKSIGYSGLISFLLAALCTAPPRRYSRKTKMWVLSKSPLHFLPQGAPTSPTLSNFVCQELDSEIASLALKFGYRYTRYADDLTFSSEKVKIIDPKFRSQIFECIKKHGLQINLKKERYSNNYKPLKVTGIVINNDILSLPRKWVRNLRAALFQLKKLSGSGEIEEILTMQRKIEGYCSYATMVNKEKYQKYFEEFDKIKTTNLNNLNE